ncbi:uncharacterized protein A4U43_C08F16830 [Asparagus officinalis]|nr:uncharacterized protein A4U43_C08F16830 [Asparagus officinalis]
MGFSVAIKDISCNENGSLPAFGFRVQRKSSRYRCFRILDRRTDSQHDNMRQIILFSIDPDTVILLKDKMTRDFLEKKAKRGVKREERMRRGRVFKGRRDGAFGSQDDEMEGSKGTFGSLGESEEH